MKASSRYGAVIAACAVLVSWASPAWGTSATGRVWIHNNSGGPADNIEGTVFKWHRPDQQDYDWSINGWGDVDGGHGDGDFRLSGATIEHCQRVGLLGTVGGAFACEISVKNLRWTWTDPQGKVHVVPPPGGGPDPRPGNPQGGKRPIWPGIALPPYFPGDNYRMWLYHSFHDEPIWLNDIRFWSNEAPFDLAGLDQFEDFEPLPDEYSWAVDLPDPVELLTCVPHRFIFRNDTLPIPDWLTADPHYTMIELTAEEFAQLGTGTWMTSAAKAYYQGNSPPDFTNDVPGALVVTTHDVYVIPEPLTMLGVLLGASGLSTYVRKRVKAGAWIQSGRRPFA